MTLNSAWKKWIKRKFEKAFVTQIHQTGQDYWHVEDLMTFCHDVPYYTRPSANPKYKDKEVITTGIQIFQLLTNKIANLCRYIPYLRGIIFIWDECEYILENKLNTQAERDNSYEAEPYTPEQIKKHKIRITDGTLPDMFRFMATRHLRDDLYRYLSEKFMSSDWHIKLKRPKQLTMFILGARLTCYDKCHKNGNSNDDDDGMELEDGELDDDFLGEKREISNCGGFKKRFHAVVDHNPMVHYSRPINIHIDMFEQDVKIIQFPSFEIGEGDIKIVTAINHFILAISVNPIVCVTTKDGDLISILLLNMRKWITQKGFLLKIYLDLSYCADVTEIAEMNLLWTLMIREMRKIYKEVVNPIEVFAILILLTKTDYTRGFYGIGPGTIWNNFSHHGGGHHFFHPDTVQIIEKPESVKMPFEVHVQESFVVDFIRYIYTCIASKVAPDHSQLLTFAELYKRLFANKKLDVSQIENMDKVLSEVRRIFFVLDYWLNASFGKQWFILKKDDVSGLPILGWIKTTVVMGPGEHYDQILLAEKVCPFSSSPVVKHNHSQHGHHHHHQQQLEDGGSKKRKERN
jgi:hypothetical protein